MQVFKKRTLAEYGKEHPDALTPLMAWYGEIKSCTAKHRAELQQTFATADPVGRKKELTCFNIKGNDYRLIAKVQYRSQMVFIREILTHDEYTAKYVKGKKR